MHVGRAAGINPVRGINYLGAQNDMASRLDALVHQKYLALPTPGKVMATYIWIDGTGQVRSYCLVP